MYCTVLACDLDGTTEADGLLAPEAAAALAAARSAGMTVVLVTGRVCEEIAGLVGEVALFDAIVAENGAAIWFPETDRRILIGRPPADELLQAMRRRGIPFHCGSVVLGTSAGHAAEVMEIVRELALDVSLVFNREALMVLPRGVDKWAGVERALVELGRSPHNLVAFGDSNNDLPLFSAAELAVAVRGTAANVAAQADTVAAGGNGTGVAAFVRNLLASRGSVATPDRHRIRVGCEDGGGAVELPACGTNVMLSGDPHTGKSWLIGLIAEQLLDRDYRLCVIDPEGDHLSLAERPQTLLVGRDIALPDPPSAARLFRGASLSVVFNLSTLSARQREDWVRELIAELHVRARSEGLPHWVVLDEAHYFFPEGRPGPCPLDGALTFLFATYRPSLVSSDVYAAVDAHLFTGTAWEDERYAMRLLLQAKGHNGARAAEAIGRLDRTCWGLLFDNGQWSRWQTFRPDGRITPHAHHARKYAETRLADREAFWFQQTGNGGLAARNVVEFHDILRSVPLGSLRHHLVLGDFSQWIAGVIGDECLADELRQIEHSVRSGAALDRESIRNAIQSAYRI